MHEQMINEMVAVIPDDYEKKEELVDGLQASETWEEAVRAVALSCGIWTEAKGWQKDLEEVGLRYKV